MATQTRAPRRAKVQTAENPAQQKEKVADNMIHTKQLAEELGTTGVALRKILRQYFYPDGQFTIYAWKPGDPILLEIAAKYQEVANGRVEKKTTSAEKTTTRRQARRSKKSEVAVGDLEETEELEELDADEEDLDDLEEDDIN